MSPKIYNLISFVSTIMSFISIYILPARKIYLFLPTKYIVWSVIFIIIAIIAQILQNKANKQLSRKPAVYEQVLNGISYIILALVAANIIL